MGGEQHRIGDPRPKVMAAPGASPEVRASIAKVLEKQPWETLRPALLATGVDVEAALGKLKQYAELLLEWNRSVSNIMSKNDEDRIVERHLLESIAPAQWLRESGAERWIDFGSGAGFPAVPLAIAGVGSQWTLVESRRTKTLFVRKAIQVIGLAGFEVINDRLENIVPESDRAGAYGGFVSRATLRLGPTLELAAHLVKPGGSAFLWKGSGHEEERTQDSSWGANWDAAGIVGVGTGQNVVARFTRK
jgi:16S rRNA (guanine527-N7)-methyltransferase